MYPDPVTVVLSCLDQEGQASLGYDELCVWPEGVVSELVRLDILRERTFGGTVECDGCEERCIEEVDLVRRSDGQTCAYVYCHERDDVGRMPVGPERLKRWDISMDGLLRTVQRLLGLTAPYREAAAGRLWWLGAPRWNGARTDLYVARRATWRDSKGVFCGNRDLWDAGVVLALAAPPDDGVLGPGIRGVSLLRVVAIEGQSLMIDAEGVFGQPVCQPTGAGVAEEVFCYEHYPRLVRFHGRLLPQLSKTMAWIVSQLYDAWGSGKPDVVFAAMRFPEDISNPMRMSHIFKRGDERTQLIRKVTEGVYRLNV